MNGEDLITDQEERTEPCRLRLLECTCLMLLVVLEACAGGQATPALIAVPIPIVERLTVDLDGDGGRDEVLIEVVERLNFFSVTVRHDAVERSPYGGDWQPGDRIGLEWRGGAGDVRCRDWRPGVTCGYPAGGGPVSPAIAVHHSRLGQVFLIPQVEPGTAPEALRFTVGQALEPRTALRHD